VVAVANFTGAMAGPADVVRLADGRAVGVAEHGDRGGRPVFLLHGTPSSRLGFEVVDEPARARGVRVLCPDRPGIGRSDPAPVSSRVGDYAPELAALGDALRIDTFAVLGYSGGGPFALAAAALLPDRVHGVGLVAGVGPLDRPGARESLSKTDVVLLDLCERLPSVAGAVLRAMAAGTRRAPKTALRIFKTDLRQADRHAVEEDGQGLALMASFVEALRQGPGGVIDDYRIPAREWDFGLADVHLPVHIWQGDDDTVVPPERSEDLAEALPNAVLHRLPGEGHISILRRMGEVLDSVAP